MKSDGHQVPLHGQTSTQVIFVKKYARNTSKSPLASLNVLLFLFLFYSCSNILYSYSYILTNNAVHDDE